VNKVELIGIYGSDEIISCSAWTSTSRKLTDEKKARIGKLINDLWKDGHETPMEKGIVHFLVDSDIASHIHLLKHRMSSANSESARYKELKEDKYYLPKDWEGIKIVDNDIDCYTYQGLPIFEGNWKDVLEEHTKLGNILYHKCLQDLTPILGRKRAKESARFFKTYNSQIECDIMFNMRSFANFQKLRNSPHAQLEIREIAQEMYRLIEETGQFKHTLEAWKNKEYQMYLELKKKFEGVE
jgi:flavin-dependent thymidylate synthase